MGTSTDGQICFGIQFEEDYRFPWNSDNADIDNWWLYKICGYTNPFELYDEEGEWLNGIKPSQGQIKEYYDPQREFEKEHPLPVELINYCSGDYPDYIVAIPRTCMTSSRGFPKAFNPKDFVITEEEATALVAFCQEHCQPYDEDYDPPDFTPHWYLSSYWG